MDNSVRLFGERTKGDWVALRDRLLANPKDDIWTDTLTLVDKRLETRYFKPIEQILKLSLENGEGFAVMTLICSLIEFLQSLYEGKVYKYRAAETNTVYGQSGAKFKAFLEQHEPFRTIFTRPVSVPADGINTIADDFYKNVRCGLLHEAATNNGWTIRSITLSSSKYDFVCIQNDADKIIYRETFVQEIRNYTGSYKLKILNDETDDRGLSLRDNLCRKIDSICEISDQKPWWWQI